MRRAAENRAGAVIHQDEIGHIDRQLPFGIEGMDRGEADVEAQLLGRFDRFLAGARAPALLDEGGEFAVCLGQLEGERVIGGERAERGAKEGVGPGGVDGQRAVIIGHAGERKTHQRAVRFADPVALHDAHLLGPALEPLETLQQGFSKIRDPEKPLGQFALLDRGAGTPALAVNYLFVGEHGVVDRIPVDLGGLAFDQAGLQEIQKQLLLVPVVVGIAGGDLAGPIKREPEHLQLAAHGVNVGVGPLGRVHAALHGGVFGRHAKGVPAHGMEHVEALGAFGARHNIPHRVVAHMPHMDAARRVGEHLQHVVFRTRRRLVGHKELAVVPDLLPVLFAHRRVVALARHGLLGSGSVRSE